MDDRHELQQSFDPRTWMQDPGDEQGPSSASRAKRRALPAQARPPFFLAAITAVGIFSIGAAGAFLTRADDAGATEIAATLEPSGDTAATADAGASVAGDQP